MVKACTKVKDWTSKNGQAVPVYEVTFYDGTKGESFGKEIPAGTPLDQLEITEGQYGKKIKMKAAPGSGGGGFGKRPDDKAKVPCMILAYCKDLVIADKIKFDQMLPAADKMLAWVKTKEL